MNSFETKIHGFPYYEKLFKDWIATETIVDENKAIWELKNPENESQKICLYKDRYTLFVYGAYGQYSFDSMTWIADIHTIAYDNLDYQFQKLNNDSKKALYVFDNTQAKDDIITWFKQILNENYSVTDYQVTTAINFLNKYDNEIITPVDDFISDTPSVCEFEDLLKFTCKLLKTVSESDEKADYISFLRNNTSTIDDFEDASQSSLWNIGMITHQSYYITMYALKLCSEKLKSKETN